MIPPAPPIVKCEFCGAERKTRGIVLDKLVYWNPDGPEACTCPKGAAEYAKVVAESRTKELATAEAERACKQKERIKRIMGNSGIGARFRQRTFESFQITPENREAAKIARQYADAFSEALPKDDEIGRKRNGLYFVGPVGTGKTHLAVAVANKLIGQGVPVICMTMIDLLDRIKRTFSGADTDSGAVLNLYKSVPLLVIDDMGKERPTEWAVTTIYNIINGRYEAGMPTIVTTNYGNDDLIDRLISQEGDIKKAESIVDRLHEMCVAIVMAGESWRSR